MFFQIFFIITGLNRVEHILILQRNHKRKYQSSKISRGRFKFPPFWSFCQNCHLSVIVRKINQLLAVLIQTFWPGTAFTYFGIGNFDFEQGYSWSEGKWEITLNLEMKYSLVRAKFKLTILVKQHDRNKTDHMPFSVSSIAGKSLRSRYDLTLWLQ